MSIITAIAAFIGAVLGVANWIRNYKLDQLHLKVLPEFHPQNVCKVGSVIPSARSPELHKPRDVFHVTVANLSTFPVTITKVGLMFEGEKFYGEFSLQDEPGFPCRLEPRDSCTATLYSKESELPKGKAFTGVFAETACCHTVKGDAIPLERLKSGLLAADEIILVSESFTYRPDRRVEF
jgi:hypothetical protein